MTDKKPAIDAFEAEYMSGGGKVLHRSKRRSRLMAIGMFAFALLTGGLGAMTLFVPGPSFVPLLMLACTALFVFLGLTLSVVRTTVGSEEVHVQFGLWGPRVRLDAIESCRVIDYDWKKFGGWGIKRAWDGTMAYTLSPFEQVVELAWTEGGKTKKAVFNAADPQVVAHEIQRARALRQSSARGARVDGAAESSRDLDAELELLAEEERGRSQREAQ